MFEKQNKYYVYVYLDPTKSGFYKFEGLQKSFRFEPFYVGKGCGKREFYHNYSAKKSKDQIERKYCSGYCQELHSLGFDPIIIRYQDNLFEEEAYELEKKLIKIIGRKSHGEGTLLNYHFGGKLEGGFDFHTEEMRKQLSRNHYFNRKDYKPQDHWNFENTLSEETKQKISNSHKGKKLSEEHKQKIRENMKNVVSGDDHYTKSGLSESHKSNLKLARRKLDEKRITEIFDIMIKHNHTFETGKFNKVNYELARSKVYARMYPKFESILKFFSEDQIKHYFANKSSVSSY